MSSESFWIDFTAGWISGGISTLAIQPIDTILTRMQANASIIVVQPSTSSSSAATANVSTSSTAATALSLRPGSIFRGMISNFGISSLWRGSSAMIGAVPIQNAVLMTGYGYGKRWTTDNYSSNNDGSNNNVLLGVFIGGTVGGILQSFVMSPIELIKVSQQVNIGKSISAATTSVISGLLLPSSGSNTTTTNKSSSSSVSAWRGLGATLLRDGIPHGVWFASYEFAKVELTKMMRSNNSSKTMMVIINDDGDTTTNDTKDEIIIPMLSGAFAATTAWGVGYPFDLIKTRIQAGKSTGIINTARDIVKESSSSSSDGRARACYGLYRGFGLKLLRSIPASAIGFLVYETVAKALSTRG